MSDRASEFIAEVAKGAALYERALVPCLFGPFAEDLIEKAALREGERLLDLGCGTGIIARLAARRVGDSGHVVGLDPNRGFLDVARGAGEAPAIEWLEGDAQDLGAFADASFDVTISQQVFQFIPDRERAASEIRRVLTPGGRALISVWTALDDTPFHAAYVRALERHVGPEAAAPIRQAVYGLSSADELAAALISAGFTDIEVVRHERALEIPSVENLARTFIEIPPTSNEELEAADRIAADVASELAGVSRLSTFTNVATARKASA
jgi:ubiquinone/menaquinone biosynthesis C-methylase UbiE